MQFDKQGPNPAISVGEDRIGILMTRRDKSVHILIVDRKNYAKCQPQRWCVAGTAKSHPRSTLYAQTKVLMPNGKRKWVSAHKFLFGGEGYLLDHENGDGLCCVETNMRRADTYENARNRGKNRNNVAGYKGVSAHGSGWRAMIGHLYKHISLGTYRTREEAARAYDKACIALHGVFGKPNFPLAV